MRGERKGRSNSNRRNERKERAYITGRLISFIACIYIPIFYHVSLEDILLMGMLEGKCSDDCFEHLCYTNISGTLDFIVK